MGSSGGEALRRRSLTFTHPNQPEAPTKYPRLTISLIS